MHRLQLVALMVAPILLMLVTHQAGGQYMPGATARHAPGSSLYDLQQCKDRCEDICYMRQCEVRKTQCKRTRVGYGACEPGRHGCTRHQVFTYKCKCRRCGKQKDTLYVPLD